MDRNAFLLIVLLTLAACGGAPVYHDVEGLDFWRVETIEGRSFEISRLGGAQNLFLVRSQDGQPALSPHMLRAVSLVSRCDNHKVVEAAEDGTSLKVQGVFCPKGRQY
jgi:hypothetical protein